MNVMKNGRTILICDWQVSFKGYDMTPSWLKTHASYIDSNHVITTDQITFGQNQTGNAALLKVPLVDPGVLEDGTPLTVEMTVANDICIGQTVDSNIRYGVSDGTNFIGFETTDMEYYHTLTPCFGEEGELDWRNADKYSCFDKRCARKFKHTPQCRLIVLVYRYLI